jgi:hypothetical protein
MDDLTLEALVARVATLPSVAVGETARGGLIV